MNAKKIIYSAALLLGLGSLASCSDNYLQLAPESQANVSVNELTKTVANARLGMIGICQAMDQQYQDIQAGSDRGYNFMNGEAYVNHRFGDAFGADQHCGIAMDMWGYEIMTGQSPWQKDNYVMCVIIWKYCYNLIMQANAILDGIDNAEGAEKERDMVKAQVLTLRAHAYTKLMQYYAPRWEDSRNGAAMCAVMRTTGSTQDAPLCSMNDVMKLIYDDLDLAIQLYQSSGEKREEKFMPDLNVAYGIYARAAMIIHDYQTAQTMAHNAWQGYKVMDNKTYMSGFFTDNDDLIWESGGLETNLYYWSEYTMMAPNGAYTANWETPDAIDYELYKQLDPKDIRRQLYMTPDKLNDVANPGKITEAEFWNPELVNETNKMSLAFGGYEKDKKNPSKKWGVYNVALNYSYKYATEIFNGDLGVVKNYDKENGDRYMYYYIKQTSAPGYVRLTKTEYAKLMTIPFGAQYKFLSVAPYSAGVYPYMRATEMKLLEAEAAYYNGDVNTTNAVLQEINGMRIPGYAFSGSGQALLDELRLCRRIELWGEGHSWPDFKRWSLPIVRKAWVANDPTSGNWPNEFAVETPVNKNGGWRMLIPKSETQYNKAIDQSLLEFN